MIPFIISLKDNAIFAGLFATMMMGSVMYMMKAVPQKLWHFLFRYFTVHLTVTSGDEVFMWVNEWLSEHDYAKRARTLRISPKPDSDNQWSIAPGIGMHWFWDGGPVVVQRELDEKGSILSEKVKETFNIWTLGRNQGKIRNLIERARLESVKKTDGLLRFSTWIAGWGWWPVHINKGKRDISTVFLPPAQKKEILDKIDWFLKNESWYRQRGVPYREGFVFHGPPGTGKTTLISALAGHFDRTMCLLSPGSMQNDEELMDAFRKLPKRAVIVIEDVDCIQASKAREPKKKKASATEPGTVEKATKDTKPSMKITLSGMLNAIDGVTTSEGHLLMMTTNHLEKIDPALIREGRANEHFKIDNMEPALVVDMAKHFFPDRPELWEAIGKEANDGQSRSPAYWQNRMMGMHIREVEEKRLAAEK